ncbi:MAG: hypothetical protein AAGJ46_03940 [Planctomycetota bacterium]
MANRLPRGVAARVAAVMFSLALGFWLTTVRPVPLSRSLPTTVAAYAHGSEIGIGFLSHGGLSTAYASTQIAREGFDWSERIDGHYCGGIFYQPIAGQDLGSSSYRNGLGISLALGTLGWSCPYWLMMVTWAIAFACTSPQTRFRLRDLALAATLAACFLTLVRLRCAMPLALLLNVATATLLISVMGYSLTQTIRRTPVTQDLMRSTST